MTEPSHHLAQFNLGRLRHPREAPEMAGYRAALDPVTAVARAWPGFIWLHDDSIVALAAATYGREIAANLSLWRDLASLRGFMDCPPHAAVMAQRDLWFARHGAPGVALWWLPAGQRPSFEEGRDRLALLRRQGPSAAAFDLDRPFGPLGVRIATNKAGPAG